MSLRIKRTSGRVENLFFLSPYDDLSKTIHRPSIPDNFLTRGKFQDWQLPRTRLYENVGDALGGLFLNEKLTGMELTVYKAKNVRSESLILPGLSAAPYTMVLPEWWYLGNLYLERLARIRVGKEIGKTGYRYGPRQTLAYIRKWEWSEIKEKWQKKGRLDGIG